MDKIETENELNFKVTNKTNNQTLIDENCCTLLTISLTNSGDIFTTFLGAYNEDILKMLKHTQKQYYKSLIKKLRSSQNKDGTTNVVDEANNPNSNTTENKTKNDKEVNKNKTVKSKQSHKGENKNEKK